MIHHSGKTFDFEVVKLVNELKNGDIVSVKVDSPERSLIFGDVVVRVREDFAPAVHIDTDEGNAAGLSGSVEGEIIK